MADDEKPKASGIVGAASKITGASVGTAVLSCKKVFQFLAGMPLSRPLPELEPQAVAEAPALQPPGDEKVEDRVAALEDRLAQAQRELTQARDEAREAQAQLRSQLNALQAENQSLRAELTDARQAASNASGREGADGARVAALEPELADAQRGSTNARDETTQAQSRPESQLADVRKAAAEEAATGRAPTALHPDAEADAAKDAREPRPTIAGSEETSSGGVTPEEVEAATFAGATEKVMFRRALSVMESADQAARIEAARMLGGIRHRLTVRAIGGRFAREPAADVREECVKALSRLGLQEGVSVAERALADAAVSVRLAAVRGICRLAGPGGATTLVPVLRDESEDVRRRAATCIGWLGQKRLAAELLPLLADRSAAVRSAALEAMGNLRSRQVAARVVELLDDPEESVRQKAFRALRAITGEQIADTLPEDEGSRHRLIARWRARWEEESRIAGT